MVLVSEAENRLLARCVDGIDRQEGNILFAILPRKGENVFLAGQLIKDEGFRDYVLLIV